MSNQNQNRRVFSVVVREPFTAHCGNCNNQLGAVRNGNLVTDAFIIINRTTMRCGLCREKLEFIPERPRLIN